MPDTTVVFPPDIDAALSERAAIWANLSQTVATRDEVEKVGKAMQLDIRSAQPAEMLTSEKTPTAELMAVLNALKLEAAAIERAEETIEMHETKISDIKTRQIILIVLGIAVVLVTLYLIAVQAGLF